LIRRKIIFINKYDREEAAIEDNIAASKGLNPISNNSNNMTHRDRLLTISNIDHANDLVVMLSSHIYSWFSSLVSDARKIMNHISKPVLVIQ
jgi:GTP:adenosylcobinamide-phosphate guanylyltransferase